jgi:hypothetical protein
LRFSEIVKRLTRKKVGFLKPSIWIERPDCSFEFKKCTGYQLGLYTKSVYNFVENLCNTKTSPSKHTKLITLNKK